MARFQLLTPEGNPYTPLLSQSQFHQSKATYKAYVGGWGSGKTLCGAVEALITALRYPRSYGIVTRWSYRELQATSFKTLIDIIPPLMIQSFNKSSLLLVLKNGSQIQGFNLANHKRLTSLNLDYFWVDEVTEVEEDLFLQLQGRLRGRAPRRGWVTGNPNGRDWVWRTFVDEHRPGYEFLHAKTYQNIYLPQDYIDNLRSYLPAEWVDRFIEGSFDVFEGQVYNEFAPHVHVLRPDDLLPIPKEWARFRGIDHGIYHPTCCLWVASDADENLFVYDCYYERNRLVSENAEEILKRSGDDIIDWTVIDPSTSRRDAVTGTSIRDEYRRLGVNTLEGANPILDGVSRIKELLRVDPEHRHPITLARGAPRLYFLSSCDKLTWEMQQYRWKDQRPGFETAGKEIPVDKHNHALDALRYIVMQNPRSHDKPTSNREWDRWQHLLDDIAPNKAPADPYQIGGWIK